MSVHSLLITIDTNHSKYSPENGYTHLTTDIQDWLNEVFLDCEIGYEVKSVHLLPATNQAEAN
jgi:hypothetical protein